jgi:predicted peroxiredoxin
MSVMRGLTIIVAGTDPARLRGALELAAAWAALDRPACIFLQAEAVELLRTAPDDGDKRRREAGLPGIQELLEEGLALGVKAIACQSGLALAGLSAEDLPAGVETGGLVDLLSRRAEDQLVLA